MVTKIITAQEQDSAALILQMMKWNNIHHLPILNDANELSGLLTWSDVGHHEEDQQIYKISIRDLMRKDLVTISPKASVKEAKEKMKKHKVKGLPVVVGKALVGIVTTNDLQ